MNALLVRVWAKTVSFASNSEIGELETSLIEPLGLEYISSYLTHHGIKNRIFDFLLRGQLCELLKTISTFKPKVIGFSTPFDSSLRETLPICATVKSIFPEALIVLGGNCASNRRHEVLSACNYIDAVVVGEGEEPFRKLCKTVIEGGNLGFVEGISFRTEDSTIVDTKPAQKPDIDSLPWPERQDVSEYITLSGVIPMLRSRGCYAKCKYCGIVPFTRSARGKPWRARKSEDVAAELGMLVKRFPQADIWFVDDEFIGPGQKARTSALELARCIERIAPKVNIIIQTRADSLDHQICASYARAGLKKVFLGVESGTQKQLDFLGKNLDMNRVWRALEALEENRIFSELGFIGIHHDQSERDLQENIHFLLKVAEKFRFCHLYMFNTLQPFEGTWFFENLSKDNRLIKSNASYMVPLDEKSTMLSEFIYSLYEKMAGLTEAFKTYGGYRREDNVLLTALWEKNRLFVDSIRSAYIDIYKNPVNNNLESILEQIDNKIKQFEDDYSSLMAELRQYRATSDREKILFK